PVGAPVLRELDRRAQQVSLVLVELRLEALEQGEGIGGTAREPAQNALVIEPPHLAGARLDDDVAERHLAVAAHRDALAAPYAENRAAVELCGLGHNRCVRCKSGARRACAEPFDYTPRPDVPAQLALPSELPASRHESITRIQRPA